MKTFKTEIYDDRAWYVWDNRISFCPHEEELLKESGIELDGANLIEIVGENYECSILLNGDYLFDVEIELNGGASFDICYKILLELENILTQEGEDFLVEINVSYNKDEEEILEE